VAVRKLRRALAVVEWFVLLLGCLVCGCAGAPTSRLPSSSAAASGPLEFRITQFGPLAPRRVRVELSMINVSTNTVFVLFDPNLDWVLGYVLVGRPRKGEAVGAGSSLRGFPAPVPDRVCPGHGNIFAIAPGERLRRIIEFDRTGELRNVVPLKLKVTLDVVVFDSSFACRTPPFVSGVVRVTLE
jgi:hypothetical protein